MMDIICMMMVILLLAICVMYKTKKCDGQNHFFDINNTKAMRGFWCIVIMMVHVPAAHGNIIQDLIGSFAFVGVTFFFMTSSYGMTLNLVKDPNRLKFFWRSRLPKLLIVSWVVNAVVAIPYIVVGMLPLSGKSVQFIFDINLWVKWLIICYFFFWISNLLFKKPLLKNIVISALVILLSVVTYYLKMVGIYTKTTWHTECYGFIWGILLAYGVVKLYSFFINNWLVKTMLLCFVAGILGVLYLKYKFTPVLGDYDLKIILGIAILMFVLAINSKYSFGNNVSIFLGNLSFEIYLIHGRVYDFLDYVYKDWFHSGIFIVTSIVITIIIAYITNVISTYLIEKLYKLKFFNIR